MNYPAANCGVSVVTSIHPRGVTPECFNRGSILLSPVVSSVEPPIEAFGNDGREDVWKSSLRSKLREMRPALIQK